jgi:acetyl-CoA carboxylase biotin carboxylase subunit
VEHPITEMITGIDIVNEQIKIASGRRLGFKQEDLNLNGVALECRINAEDPDNGFKPCPGRISLFFPPGGMGIRIDTHVYSGYPVSTHYDSLLAKIIVHRKTREEAIESMKNALEQLIMEGVKTTIPLSQDILSHINFIRANIDTNFIDEYFG